MGFLQYRALGIPIASSQCQYPQYQSHQSVLWDWTHLQHHPRQGRGEKKRKAGEGEAII